MKMILTFGFLALSLQVQAKTLHHYNAQIQGKNISNVRPGLFQGHLKGWSCKAEMKSRIVESQANHQGKLKEITWSNSSKTERRTEAKSQVQFNDLVIVNHDHVQPKLESRLEEVCTKDWSRYVYDNPATKEDESGYVTETATLNMWWDCQVPGEAMPKAVGQTKDYKCHKGGWNVSNAESPRDVEKYAKTRDKEIDIDLNLAKVTEENKDYFNSCQGRPDSDAVIINLSQGVGGHWGENDYVFNVSLDGGQKLKISRNSGLLSDDIKYCPPDKRGNISVDIQAVEEDFPLALSDKYRSQELDLSAKGGTGTISLDRKILGRAVYKSSIAVKVKPYQAPAQPVRFEDLPRSGASADWTNSTQ